MHVLITSCKRCGHKGTSPASIVDDDDDEDDEYATATDTCSLDAQHGESLLLCLHPQPSLQPYTLNTDSHSCRFRHRLSTKFLRSRCIFCKWQSINCEFWDRCNFNTCCIL